LKVAASGVADEFDSQTPLAEIPLVSIDTETTGRDPRNDRIVEIACVVLLGGEIVDKQVWLVNPGRPIPKEAFDVHGISDEDVESAPPFSELVSDLAQAMKDKVPVAYNAEFDQVALLAELDRAKNVPRKKPPAFRPGTAWLDPLVWARELYKEEKSRSLGAIAGLLNVQRRASSTICSVRCACASDAQRRPSSSCTCAARASTRPSARNTATCTPCRRAAVRAIQRPVGGTGNRMISESEGSRRPRCCANGTRARRLRATRARCSRSARRPSSAARVTRASPSARASRRPEVLRATTSPAAARNASNHPATQYRPRSATR
jgi:hypothetical protein